MVDKQEPVAWRHRGPKGGWITTEEKTQWSEEPLYPASSLASKAAEIAALRERVKGMENALISAECGGDGYYILANYREIRREVQARRSALQTGGDNA